MQEEIDVLIAGSGSAGLSAALWLSLYGISYKILEQRSGPLKIGQADSVQVRTVEILESFGLADKLLHEGYHSIEVAFWAVDESPSSLGDRSIKRMHLAADTPPGLSHVPHIILSQARINSMITSEIERVTGSMNIEYGTMVQDVRVDGDVSDSQAYPVGVVAVRDGVQKEIRAKYVLVSKFAFYHII
jgi:phenol 2-monooxygenase